MHYKMEYAQVCLKSITESIAYAAPEIMKCHIGAIIDVMVGLDCLRIADTDSKEPVPYAMPLEPRATAAFDILRKIKDAGHLAESDLRALVEQFAACGWLTHGTVYSDPRAGVDHAKLKVSHD